jgi:hypothetical protein
MFFFYLGEIFVGSIVIKSQFHYIHERIHQEFH